MVTIAIVGILVAVAAPSIDALSRRSRLDADTERFQTALAYARSEAVKRNTTVSIVPADGGYGNGWAIITDDAGRVPNCALSTANGESLLRVQGRLSQSTQFVIGSTTSTPVQAVSCDVPPASVAACTSFDPRGKGVDVNGFTLVQTMCLRDTKNPTTLRAITINSEGQAFLAKVQ